MKRTLTMLAMAASLTAIAQIPTNGLTAYYPFNGNANDNSGNCQNGTITGATLTTDRFNRPNSAYYFDGSDINFALKPVKWLISTAFWFYTEAPAERHVH